MRRRWVAAVVAICLWHDLALADAPAPNHAAPAPNHQSAHTERVYVYRLPGKFNRHIIPSPSHHTSERYEIAMERRMHQMMLHHPNRCGHYVAAALFYAPALLCLQDDDASECYAFLRPRISRTCACGHKTCMDISVGMYVHVHIFLYMCT